MAEPPLPITPPGQPRDFNLVLPEVSGGAFDVGPGSEIPEFPEGSPLTSCQQQIVAFADSGNDVALVDLIETETSQTIQELTEPTYSQVLADGITRTHDIVVCALTVHLTLDRVEDCERLPQATLTWSQHDFDLPSRIEGDNPSVPEFLSTYYITEEVPDIQMRIEDARLTWLKDTPEADHDIVAARGPIGGFNTEIDGEFYVPVCRIYMSWTATLNIQKEYVGLDLQSTLVNSFPPIVGFTLSLRLDPEGEEYLGDPPQFVTQLTTDPIRKGTLVIASGLTFVHDSDYFVPDRYGPMLPNQRYPTSDTTRANMLFGGASVEEGDPSSIWAALDGYNALAGPYDPELTYDVDAHTVTVRYNTRENAIYIGQPYCGSTDVTMNHRWGLNMVCGSYVHEMNGEFPRGNLLDTDETHLQGVMIREIRDGDPHTYVANTNFAPMNGALDVVVTGAAAEDSNVPPTSGDAEPPPTETNPPLVPVGGGCRSSLDGPSSCNWTVPVPASPQPEVPDPEAPSPEIPPVPNFPMPGDNFPDVPVLRTELPNIPNLPCIIPDFGNMDPCGKGNWGNRNNGGPLGNRGGGAGPGTLGPLPGARDRMGHRGSAGSLAALKTGGPTNGSVRTYVFLETTCPSQLTPGIGCMALITQLLMDAGIAPIDIIFQIGPEWDKPFPPEKCFAKGSRFWDAAVWTARYIMCIIVDEGAPTNDVYIGPPWHRPGQSTWIFDEHIDLFALTRNTSAEEAYGWVEVFGPNVTEPIIVRIEDPFSSTNSPTLQMEVGANYSQADAEGLASFRASEIRREALSMQAVVPYSSEYFLRDNMLIRAPDRGFQETYVITGKESDISAAGYFHILTGMLPATLAELDAFPEVTDEYSAIDLGGFA